MFTLIFPGKNIRPVRLTYSVPRFVTGVSDVYFSPKFYTYHMRMLIGVRSLQSSRLGFFAKYGGCLLLALLGSTEEMVGRLASAFRR